VSSSYNVKQRGILKDRTGVGGVFLSDLMIEWCTSIIQVDKVTHTRAHIYHFVSCVMKNFGRINYQIFSLALRKRVTKYMSRLLGVYPNHNMEKQLDVITRTVGKHRAHCIKKYDCRPISRPRSDWPTRSMSPPSIPLNPQPNPSFMVIAHKITHYYSQSQGDPR
jgi:hypothetical protein